MAPTLHRTSENIRGSIRPCGSRPDFCKFFTSCFCTTAWCCHDAMRVPTTRRRQDAPSSSGRRVPTTPPSIVGRGVLTMPPRVVRTSWRRHDAPPVPRRQLRFSDVTCETCTTCTCIHVSCVAPAAAHKPHRHANESSSTARIVTARAVTRAA